MFFPEHNASSAPAAHPTFSWRKSFDSLSAAAPWNWVDFFSFIFLFLAVALFVGSTATYFSAPHHAAWRILIQSAAYVLWLIFTAHLFCKRTQKKWLPPLPQIFPAVGKAILIAFILFPLIGMINFLWTFLLQKIGISFEQQASIRFFGELQTFGGKFLFVVLSVGIAPIVEEVVFRGMLLPLCIRKWGALLGVLNSTAIFVLLHFHLGSCVPLFLFSAALALIYVRTRQLLIPIFLHILFNAATLLVYFWTASI